MQKEWNITLDNFQGFAPGWWGSDFPFEGSKAHAREMAVVDLFYGNGLKQGMGITTLTNGSQAGAVTTLIKHILDFPVATNVTYAIGGNLLHKITSEVVDDATWPHTIDKGAVTAEDGESVCAYKGALYYFYNHSGTAGDIGKYDLASTFDDDWGSTVPTGAATLVGGVPHQAIVGGDDVMYITNGRYIASYNGTTLVPQALDFLTGSVVSSIAWANNRLYCAVNKTSLSGNNRVGSSVYMWDTTSSSWEIETPVNGRLGALYAKDGLVYLWWEELVTDLSVYKFGAMDGTLIQELSVYSEASSSARALPMFYQVTSFKDCIVWSKYENTTLAYVYTTTVDDPVITVDNVTYTVDNSIAETNIGLLAYGKSHIAGENKFFMCLKPKYATHGAVANPFGALLVASYASTNFDLSKSANYSTASKWNTLYFHLADATRKARLHRVVVYTEPILSGGKLDVTLRYDFDKHQVLLNQIAYNAANPTKHIIYADGVDVENFALDFYWYNGSTTNPVVIRRVEISGSYVNDA